MYETELLPYVKAGREQVIAYAHALANSGNSNDYQRANELTYMMRKEGRFDEAVEIARIMYEAGQTLDRLNLYFVAVVDQGDVFKINELSRETERLLAAENAPYQKHLFATWLKAANKIVDSDLFMYIYNKIPDYEKVSNTYIISQYYVFLNRNARYEEVCEHYNRLPQHLQNATFVKRYYNNAQTRLGFNNPSAAPVSPLASPNSPVPTKLAGTPDVTTNNKKVFLVYGGQPAYLPIIESLLKSNGIQVINLANEVKTGSTIIEAFEMQAGKADFAIVMCTPDNEAVNGVWYPRMNVVFEYGYFMAKLGRRNVCLLRQEDGKKLELPTDFNSIYQISMDKFSWVGELGSALRSAGFNVVF